jgi:hypothetical protein
VAPPPPPAAFASLIVADFPALFAEFGGKRFTLLWRGSRDGFGAADFHGRCDGHANTLTLIEDTRGNIFGGFTPVKWDSSGSWKADPTLQGFLFTLKNPRNFPPTKFALKPERNNRAIRCYSSRGPNFRDIGVADNCDTNSLNHASPSLLQGGFCYAVDAVPNSTTLFAGSTNFTVKEIEVFEITN